MLSSGHKMGSGCNRSAWPTAPLVGLGLAELGRLRMVPGCQEELHEQCLGVVCLPWTRPLRILVLLKVA